MTARKMIAVGEHQPVAAVGELAGQEAVSGDDRRQPGEVGVGRVGGQDQDGERRDLRHPEQDALAVVDPRRHQGDAGRVLLAAVGLQVGGQDRDAEEASCRGSWPSRSSVAAALRDSGFRNAGTPLEIASTPERATAPEEKARSSMMNDRDWFMRASSRPSTVDVRDRPQVEDEDPEEAGDDQQDQHHDVEVRRPGEQAARLLQAAQVGHGHEEHAEQADRHRPPLVEPGRGPDGQDAAGDRHGDREDVVDEQRRAGDQRRDACPGSPG